MNKVKHKPPVLTVAQMADYIAASRYKEYRGRCLEHIRAIHGDQYADDVKKLVIAIFNKRKNNNEK